MDILWGSVNWGVGCLILIVAVACSFLLGVRTGRIYERGEAARRWFRKNRTKMFRNRLRLASYQEEVERLEREKESLAIQSGEYERVQSELADYRERMERLEQEMKVIMNEKDTVDSGSDKTEMDVSKLLGKLREDPLHANLTKEEWSEIIIMTDVFFNNFLTDLRAKYGITRHEREICCLIKWNFSRKEQLAVFNNTPDALTKSKGRLKKRLGLDEKTDLDTYIRSL